MYKHIYLSLYIYIYIYTYERFSDRLEDPPAPVGPPATEHDWPPADRWPPKSPSNDRRTEPTAEPTAESTAAGPLASEHDWPPAAENEWPPAGLTPQQADPTKVRVVWLFPGG